MAGRTARARFDGEAQFDACEWLDKVSFENARFAGPASFGTTRIPNKRLNLSRADFASAVRRVLAGEQEFRAALTRADLDRWTWESQTDTIMGVYQDLGIRQGSAEED